MQWTEARIKGFIISVLRAGTRRWPPKHNVKNAAKTEKKINEASGRLAQHYQCVNCKKEYTSTNIEVDHIQPVVDPDKGFTTWDDYISRLFCDEQGLQVLCNTCHDEKSSKEQSKRKRNTK